MLHLLLIRNKMSVLPFSKTPSGLERGNQIGLGFLSVIRLVYADKP